MTYCPCMGQVTLKTSGIVLLVKFVSLKHNTPDDLVVVFEINKENPRNLDGYWFVVSEKIQINRSIKFERKELQLQLTLPLIYYINIWPYKTAVIPISTCLFVCSFSSHESFSLTWRCHQHRWRAANLNLCLAFMTIEKWEFFSVPQALSQRDILLSWSPPRPMALKC